MVATLERTRADDAPVSRVDALIARYAYNSNDAVSAYGGWQYFLSDEPEGAVAYVRRGRVLVANGDPLCAVEHTIDVLRRFAAFCREQRLTCCFLGASERARDAALQLGFGAFKVGEEPLFDLAAYAPRGDRAKKARSARNQALRAGVAIVEYTPARGRDPRVEREMHEVLAAWCATHPVEPLAFSLRLDPFAAAQRKRYFVAELQGRIVAFVACSWLAGREGAYIEDVIRHPDAPYGSTELLILHALEQLAASGVRVASLGVAPLQGVEEQASRAHRALGRTLALARNHAGAVYKFNSLNHYKRKFAPSRVEGSYLLYRPGRLTPRLLLGLLSAFTPEGLGAYVKSRLPRWRRGRALSRTDIGRRWAAMVALAGMLASLVLLLVRHPLPLHALVLLRLHPLLLLPAAAGGAYAVHARARRH